ncbi:hypothetical protein IFR05_016926, partial [Cadophora sp. M221]
QTILIDLWLCASDLQIPKLQNLALNELDRIRNATGQMNIQALMHVYEHAPEGSLLRQYMVWQYANRLSEDAIPRALEFYPKVFMLDWIVMLTQMSECPTAIFLHHKYLVGMQLKAPSCPQTVLFGYGAYRRQRRPLKAQHPSPKSQLAASVSNL